MASEEHTALSHLPYLFHRWERPIVFLLWITTLILHSHIEGKNTNVGLFDNFVQKLQALQVAAVYCQADFDITRFCWSGIFPEWIRSNPQTPSFAHEPLYTFTGDYESITSKPFEGKPTWIEDLSAEKFIFTVNSSHVYTLEWTSSDGSKLKVVECGSHQQDNCTSTFYQSNRNITQYFIPVKNKYVDPDIFTTVTELEYTSRKKDGNSYLVDVHCCSSHGSNRSTLDNAISIDRGKFITSDRICLKSACPPPYDPSKLLAEVWKATLSSIINKATDAYFSIGTKKENLGLESDGIYNASLLHQFYSDGLATQVAVDLWKFHRSREEADSDVFLEIGIMSFVDNGFSNIPNHHWTLEEFLTIIMDTTSAFHPESLEGGNRVGTDPSLNEMYDSESLGKAIVESLTDKIDSLRRPGWQEKEFDYPLQVYNLTTMENYESIQEYEPFCDSVSLLPGSKCGSALVALDSVLSSLVSQDNDWKYHSQDFVIMVGALVIILLLIQSTLRWHCLPGGCLVKRDLKHSIDRNRQVRMALEDEYLSRERECRVIEQLGDDEAREALGLLRTAAYREPGLPHDYQMRQRKYSRWFVMGSQFAAVELIAIPRHWNVFLWVETVLMPIIVVQSVAEVCAMSLLLKQDDDSMQVADDLTGS